MKLMQRLLVVLALLLVASVGLYAQGVTGTLTGTVTTEGAPLPGATVTVSSPSLQGTRTTVTDVNGNYNFGALPTGDYTVRIELSGMQTVTRTVRVSPASSARANAELAMSAVAETITVTAAPAVVETNEVQTSLQSETIEELPVARTIQGTVLMAPGVNSNGPGNGIMISGGQSYDSVFYINGTVMNEVLRGQPLSVYIEDALAETTVLTGAISAEYGRFTGGVVTAVTKSGGNEFSGSFRDNFTDPSWTAQSEFGEPEKDSDLQETYEATFGGRIIRDRLWFFTAGRTFERSTPTTFFRSDPPRAYNFGQTEDRYEGKLTGAITPQHTLLGSWIGVQRESTDIAFGFGAYEESAVDDSSEREEQARSIHYNGIFSDKFLLEASYADSQIDFIGDGGPRGDFAHGTNVYDANENAYLGAPTFGESEFGSNNYRGSENIVLKGTYYLSTPGLGTHNIVAGYDDFTNTLHENNAQSGSDFTVYTYGDVMVNPDGTVAPTFQAYDLIIWWPILQGTRGNDFNTKSFFVNDRWDFSDRLSFNIGVRHDITEAENEAGAIVADDSKTSPRLGANFDVFGNGRLRLNASYGMYASQIANGNVGNSTSSAGSPSLIYWYYMGPDITGLPTQQALQQMWDWFQGVGGTSNREPGIFINGGRNDLTAIIPEGGLESPGMNEFTIGASTQIGSTGYVRLDYQSREWDNFYVNQLDLNAPVVFDPLLNQDIQQAYLTNSDALTREYDAVLIQGGFRPFSRLDIGANYTWSELVGNVVGETRDSGPVASTGENFKPELLGYEQRNPVGFLPQDQTHKFRAWISYDQPTPIGNFNFSLLQRFDSGTPRDVAGTIWVSDTLGGCDMCPSNPGYFADPYQSTYYFKDRGDERWDDITATDLAINYNLPIGPVEIFVQGEVRNLLNEQAQIGGVTTVRTSTSRLCKQADGSACLPFNPFTDTPVEGVNWVKHPAFGQATSDLSYQAPRTYLVSAGLKF